MPTVVSTFHQSTPLTSTMMMVFAGSQDMGCDFSLGCSLSVSDSMAVTLAQVCLRLYVGISNTAPLAGSACGLAVMSPLGDDVGASCGLLVIIAVWRQLREVINIVVIRIYGIVVVLGVGDKGYNFFLRRDCMVFSFRSCPQNKGDNSGTTFSIWGQLTILVFVVFFLVQLPDCTHLVP